MFRCFIFSTCVLFGLNAFAQEGAPAAASATPAPVAEAPQKPEANEANKAADSTVEKPVETREDYVSQGVVLGFAYEHANEKITIKYKDSSSTYNYNSQDAINFFGLRLGYASIPKDGMGLIGALQMARSGKKYSNDKYTMDYKVEGSLTIGTTVSGSTALYGFGGFHLAVVDPSNSISPVGFGLQLGAGFAFDSNWSLEAGYAGTLFRMKDSFFDNNPNIDKDGTSDLLGGFTARLNYSF